MSAGTENDIDDLTAQIAQGDQPSFGGVTAAPTPETLARILSALKQQQYQAQIASQVGRGAGDLSFLVGAGQPQFAAVGQGIANLLGSANVAASGAAPSVQDQLAQLSQTQQPTTGAGPGIALPSASAVDPIAAMSDPNANPLAALATQATADQQQPAKPAATDISSVIGIANNPNTPPAIRNAIQKAALAQVKNQYKADIANGTDPNTATLNGLKTLAQAGFDTSKQMTEVLAKQADLILKGKEGAKDDAQAAGATDEISNRGKISDRQLKANTWVDTGTGNQFFKTQRNGLGEERRVELAPQPTAAALAAGPQTDDQKAATLQLAQDVANYKVPESSAYGRGSTAQQKADFHTLVVGQNPSYDGQQYHARQLAYQNYTSGKAGQQAVRLQNAYNHLDLLDQLHEAESTGDVKAINALSNRLSNETGGTAIASTRAAVPTVASEVTGALIPGGGGLADRQEQEAALDPNLSHPQFHAAVQTKRALLAAQRSNAKSQYKNATGRNDFDSLYPIGESGGDASTTSTVPAASSSGSSGWGPVVKH